MSHLLDNGIPLTSSCLHRGVMVHSMGSSIISTQKLIFRKSKKFLCVLVGFRRKASMKSLSCFCGVTLIYIKPPV